MILETPFIYPRRIEEGVWVSKPLFRYHRLRIFNDGKARITYQNLCVIKKKAPEMIPIKIAYNEEADKFPVDRVILNNTWK